MDYDEDSFEAHLERLAAGHAEDDPMLPTAVGAHETSSNMAAVTPSMTAPPSSMKVNAASTLVPTGPQAIHTMPPPTATAVPVVTPPSACITPAAAPAAMATATHAAPCPNSAPAVVAAAPAVATHTAPCPSSAPAVVAAAPAMHAAPCPNSALAVVANSPLPTVDAAAVHSCLLRANTCDLQQHVQMSAAPAAVAQAAGAVMSAVPTAVAQAAGAVMSVAPAAVAAAGAVMSDKHGITFSADELKRFWRHYRQHMPQHPASDEHVPVGLAGDDTQYNLAGAKLIINLVSFPLYDSAASKLCRWPYFVLRYEVSLGERTLDPIWRVAAWSLNIAFGSVHPAHGRLGETWRKGSARATLAGKNLLCSYALTELRGDWKYHRETFCLKRHYTANDI
eukprot:s827_g7.t1